MGNHAYKWQFEFLARHIIRHMPEYVFKHVPKHVLRHMPDEQMLHAVLMT